MIDLRRLTEDPEYRAGALAKGTEQSMIDSLIRLDADARARRTVTEAMRAEANQANKDIGKAPPDERQEKIVAAKLILVRMRTSRRLNSMLQGKSFVSLKTARPKSAVPLTEIPLASMV